MAFFTTLFTLTLIVSFVAPDLCDDCYCSKERVACRNIFVAGVISQSLQQGQIFLNVRIVDFKTSDLNVLDLNKVLQLIPNAKSIDLRSSHNLDCENIDLDESLKVDVLANCPLSTPSPSTSSTTTSTSTSTTTTLITTDDDDSTTTEIQLYATSTALTSIKSATAEESDSHVPLSIVIPSVVSALIALVGAIIICWCCRGGGTRGHPYRQHPNMIEQLDRVEWVRSLPRTSTSRRSSSSSEVSVYEQGLHQTKIE